ncbi:MAG: 4-vinyl reductase [Desulfatibacillum sp.]|nr:4-vinyl reductase [Desulfatibacillum sp.]
MLDAKYLQIRTLLGATEFLERHPLLVRAFLKPVANAPFISKRIMVLFRAYMGATAFEIHDVDLHKGRIGIGGVEEIMAGSKIIELLHHTLGEWLAPADKERTLYEMGVKLCTWEVSQALENGKWAPALLVPLIAHAKIFDEIRTDPLVARFFKKTLDMMSRLITDEGGWGRLEFNFDRDPMTVTLHHSQEAAWLAPSDSPVCHFYAGIVAGYASTISGETVHVKEVACKACGAEACVFELERIV